MNKASLMHAIEAAKLPMLSINLCNPQSQWKADWSSVLRSRCWRYDCASEHEENTNHIRKNYDHRNKFIKRRIEWLDWMMVSLVFRPIIVEQNTPEKSNNIHRVCEIHSAIKITMSITQGTFLPQRPRVVWNKGNAKMVYWNTSQVTTLSSSWSLFTTPRSRVTILKKIIHTKRVWHTHSSSSLGFNSWACLKRNIMWLVTRHRHDHVSSRTGSSWLPRDSQ